MESTAGSPARGGNLRSLIKSCDKDLFDSVIMVVKIVSAASSLEQ